MALAHYVSDLLHKIGYSPGGIAGVMGNMQQESSMNPAQTGDNGTSIGLFMHHASRAEGLKQFADNAGKSATDPAVQVAYAAKEIQRDYPQLDKLLRDPNVDPGTAAIAFGKIFERPKEASANWKARIAYAEQFARGDIPQAPTAQTKSQAQPSQQDWSTSYGQIPQSNATQGQGQQASNQGTDEGQQQNAKVLTIKDIYDKQSADAVHEMAKRDALQKPIIDDVLNKLQAIAQGEDGNSTIPGFSKTNLAQTLALVDQMQQQNAPQEAIDAAKKDIVQNVAAPPATFWDYQLNQARQVTGASPAVAGNIIGAAISGAVPTTGIDVLSQTAQPQQQENMNAVRQNVASKVTDRLEQARYNLPPGDDAAQGVVGTLAQLPIGFATKAPILAGAAVGGIQGALSTENPTPANLAINSGIGAGVGGLVGGVLKAGSGLVRGLSGTSAKTEAGNALGNAIAQGAGTTGNSEASMNALTDVAQKFKDNPNLPLSMQNAASAEYSTIAPKQSADRVVQALVNKAASKLDGPTADAITNNIRDVVQNGPDRLNQMVNQVINTDKLGVNPTITSGQLENIVLPSMKAEGDKAFKQLTATIPNLSPDVAQKLTSTMNESKAYQQAVDYVRNSGIMQNADLANAPDSSVALQVKVRSVLNEWQHAKGGQYENKLNPELEKLGSFLRHGTEQTPGDVSTSLWGKYNDTFADMFEARDAIKLGKDINKLSPETIESELGKMSEQGQQAFAVSAMQTMRDKFAKAGYKVAPNFTNPALNEKIQLAVGSPEKMDKFLSWVGQEMQITKAVNATTGVLDKTGTTVSEAINAGGKLFTDPWALASMVRGSFLYAYSRAIGDVLQSMITGKSTSTEALRLIGAYATTTDPAKQAEMVDLVRSSYVKDYMKGRLSSAASAMAASNAGRIKQKGANQ